MASPSSQSTHSLAETDSRLKRKASEQLMTPQDIKAKKLKLVELAAQSINANPHRSPSRKIAKSIHDFTWGKEAPAEKAYEKAADRLNLIFRDLTQTKVTVDMLMEAKRMSLLYKGRFPFWDMAALSEWRSELPIEPFLLWKCLSEEQSPTDADFIRAIEEVRASAKKLLATKAGVCTTNRVEWKVQAGTTDDSGVTDSMNKLGSGSANVKAKDARAMRDDVLLAAEDLIQKSTGLPPVLATGFRTLGRAFKKYTKSLE